MRTEPRSKASAMAPKRKRASRKGVPLAQSLEHARLLVGAECAGNYVFRCGPCDYCGGACLCRPDEELVERLRAGLKPMGTFAYACEDTADQMAQRLEELGLTCWVGQNRNQRGLRRPQSTECRGTRKRHRKDRKATKLHPRKAEGWGSGWRT